MTNNFNNGIPNINNGFNPYMNKKINRERLIRQREDIDMMLNNLDMEQPVQQSPVNNIINTQQPSQNNNSMYVVKVLNESDEVENIFIDENTIFIGSGKMQIKRLDGSIEKYEIKKYYPIDIKDQKIEELTNKINEKDKQIDDLIKKMEDIERRINNEPSKSNEPIRDGNGSAKHVDEYAKSKSNSNGK